MLIDPDNHQAFRCPLLGGRNCLGQVCAMWRWSGAKGFCGTGGPPTAKVIEPPFVPPAVEVPHRIEKKTVAAFEPRYTRAR